MAVNRIRLRVLPALLPKQIEIRSDGTTVQWRHVGDTAWQDIVSIAAISATAVVGTTTTLTPGSAATVTNSGSAQHLVLNFGIPAGAGAVDSVNGHAGT